MIDRRSFMAGAGAAALSLAGAPARAGVAPVCSTGGLALGGYDPVAYFLHGRPAAGSPQYALRWRGAIWLFQSETHQIAFEMNPRGFAPRFGGYCAFSMAGGVLRTGDPSVWAIHHERLYLMADMSARDQWLRFVPEHIAAAEQEWFALLHG